MNDNFKKQIADIDDLKEIAQILSMSTELRESINEYGNDPYDTLFAVGKIKIPMKFNKKGDTIYLLGDYTGKDLDNSAAVEITLDAIENNLLTSSHSLNEGGLFTSLIEACSVNKLGFDITSDSEMSEKEFLFNDKNPAILISVSTEKEGNFVDFIYKNGIKITLLGHVTKRELRMDDISFGYISDYID